MNQLSNPSVTSPRMGDRSRASRVSPRNTTGRRYAELYAEQEAKKAAATVDIAEVQRRARERGYTDGYEKGLSDGWNVCIAALVDEGILAPDEPCDDAPGVADEAGADRG